MEKLDEKLKKFLRKNRRKIFRFVRLFMTIYTIVMCLLVGVGMLYLLCKVFDYLLESGVLK